METCTFLKTLCIRLAMKHPAAPNVPRSAWPPAGGSWPKPSAVRVSHGSRSCAPRPRRRAPRWPRPPWPRPCPRPRRHQRSRWCRCCRIRPSGQKRAERAERAERHEAPEAPEAESEVGMVGRMGRIFDVEWKTFGCFSLGNLKMNWKPDWLFKIKTPWCHDLLWLFVDANLAFLRWFGRAVWWCFSPPLQRPIGLKNCRFAEPLGPQKQTT